MSSSRSPIRALKSKNYRIYFYGQLLSLIGTWMTQLAIMWLAYKLTGSAVLVGIAGFCTQVPVLLLSPVAGWLADKIHRRTLLISTHILFMLISFCMGGLTLTGHMTPMWIIITCLAFGIIHALDMPTRQAFLVQLIDDRTLLPNAIALNSSMVNGTRLIGPAIGGFVVNLVGPGWCFIIDGFSYFAVLISLYLIKPNQPSDKSTDTLWEGIVQGFSYAFKSSLIRNILFLMALVSFSAFFYSVLTPLYASKILNGDARTLGYLMTSAGLGAMVAGIFLSTRKSSDNLPKLLPIGSCLAALGLSGFAFSTTFPSAALCLFCVGGGAILAVATSNTILQSIVEDSKRGRLMSLFTMCFMGFAPLGNLSAGYLSEHIGVRYTLLLGSALCLGASIFFITKLRRLTHLCRERIKDLERSQVPAT